MSLCTEQQAASIRKLLLGIFAVCYLSNFYQYFSRIDSYFSVDLRNRVVGARLLAMDKNPYYFKWDPTQPETLLDPIDLCGKKQHGNRSTKHFIINATGCSCKFQNHFILLGDRSLFVFPNNFFRCLWRIQESPCQGRALFGGNIAIVHIPVGRIGIYWAESFHITCNYCHLPGYSIQGEKAWFVLSRSVICACDMDTPKCYIDISFSLLLL